MKTVWKERIVATNFYEEIKKSWMPVPDQVRDKLSPA
jgi:hypothetical protein